jgi:hypothetical protein
MRVGEPWSLWMLMSGDGVFEPTVGWERGGLGVVAWKEWEEGESGRAWFGEA